MRFYINEAIYNEQGTEKAFCDTDDHGFRYYIPRKIVKVISRRRSDNDLIINNIEILVDIPDWLIKKNGIPIYRMTAMNVAF